MGGRRGGPEEGLDARERTVGGGAGAVRSV